MTSLISILGSSRRSGNTERMVRRLHDVLDGECIYLNELSYSPYDYEQSYINDDFLMIVEKMLHVETILFATPVYWYSMSAQMKVFFDRLSDLISSHKEKGRKLAGKRVFLLATGSDPVLPEGFSVPFEQTASYFDMGFVQTLYVPFEGRDAKLSTVLFDDFIHRIQGESERGLSNRIRLLISEEEWGKAYDVLSQLRPMLNRELFLNERIELQKQGYRLFGLYDEGQLCCVGGVSLLPHVERRRDLWVHDLVTISDQRSNGHGEAMMRHLEQLAQDETGHALSVYTRVTRDRAINFYEQKLGYERTSLLFKSS